MIEENCENKPLIDCQQDVADDDNNDSGIETDTEKVDVVNEEPTSHNVDKSDEGLVAKTVDDELGNKVLGNLGWPKVFSVLDQNADDVSKSTDAAGHSDEVPISHDNTSSLALAHGDICEAVGQCLNTTTDIVDCDDTCTSCSSDVDETNSCHSSDECFSNAY